MNIKEKKIILENEIIRALKEIYDPEVPVNIYELGLVYGISIDDDFRAEVTMTLTTPNCPVAESLPIEVKEKVSAIEGISDAHVEITFDPPWTMELLSDEARLELGLL
ncbi:MAG: SUF system Fe-S cluster assembly protein [Bacteroidales bacterium]|nr:SUF system Fe-S cluster assembly protein [Bacteroidales bacterium]